MTSTSDKKSTTGGWESRPVLAKRHDLEITRALSHGHSWKDATGLICIDAKPYFCCEIHRLIQMFCCHRR